MDPKKAAITVAVSLAEFAEDTQSRAILRAKIKAAIQDAAAGAVEGDVEILIEVRATDD